MEGLRTVTSVKDCRNGIHHTGIGRCKMILAL